VDQAVGPATEHSFIEFRMTRRSNDQQVNVELSSEPNDVADRMSRQNMGVNFHVTFNALAVTVGITALAITAATSAEYWPWSIIPRDRPKRAEIVPKHHTLPDRTKSRSTGKRLKGVVGLT
jgi:hypothetical protein